MTKILFLDLETSPLLTFNWSMWDDRPSKMTQDWYLLCFSYKWLGEKTVYVEGLKNGRKSEGELIKKLWKLFNEADVVIAHNLKKFDLKKSNAKFIEYNLAPPSAHQNLDTLTESRRHFGFTSHRLDSLGELLGVGRKLKHPGIEMWEGYMNGEEKWIKLMHKYNKQDVVLLEKVYEKLLPWINREKALWDNRKSCPKCGSDDTQRRGFLVNNKGRFQRHQCMDIDHSGGDRWFTGNKLIRTV